MENQLIDKKPKSSVAVHQHEHQHECDQKTQHHKPHRHKIGHKHGEGSSIDFFATISKIAHWNASFKVTFSVITLFLCILLNNPYVSVVVILTMGFITVVKGGIPFHEYLTVLMIPIAFILLGTITIAIDYSAVPPPESYSLFVGFGYLYTTPVKLVAMVFLILKVFGAISAMEMMMLSTPTSEIICVLRKAHVPKLVIELMHLIYRYVFILLDVHTKMKNSAESRQGYVDFKTACYTFGNIASNLLVISLKKSSAYYNAMESRGYDGEFAFLEEPKSLDKKQLVLAACFIVVLLLIWVLTYQ